ncbi:MAG: cyclopropane fatty acyl phospholipid synthase [Tatlockia sp.]|nr:cyclopropane fatty acyl phospholipid synthase [Tatlockia sp.]
MDNNMLEKILNQAGVSLNGSEPQDIKLLNDKALDQIMRNGSLGLGDTYMAGWWDCECLDELSFRLCRAAIDKKINLPWPQALRIWATRLTNFQNKTRAQHVARKHYNLDNHLFELMLGKTMAYSCGYWKNEEDLNRAQFAKYELICKKLKLTSQDRLLDIGCGWGGFAAYAAENYGCRVAALSIASEQIAYAKMRYQNLSIDFYVADYRDVNAYNPQEIEFTKQASIGAFEHIGYKNHRNFLKIMATQLSAEGLFLLHTIGSNETTTTTDPWIDKYIFPNGNVPSMVQLTKAMENLFLVEDWHNFGADYDKTLLAWNANFESNWPLLKDQYDQHFYRMWRYYLLMCAGMFRARSAQLWQIVLSKSGLIGGYESVR